MNRRILMGGLAALVLGACASTASAPVGPEPIVPEETEVQVTGTVLYRERIALTPEAVLHVEVVEVTPEGTIGAVIGEQRLRGPGQVPIPFSVAIEAARIRPEARYEVRARIADSGRVFSTLEPVAVLTEARLSSDVRVLVRVSGQAP